MSEFLIELQPLNQTLRISDIITNHGVSSGLKKDLHGTGTMRKPFSGWVNTGCSSHFWESLLVSLSTLAASLYTGEYIAAILRRGLPRQQLRRAGAGHGNGLAAGAPDINDSPNTKYKETWNCGRLHLRGCLRLLVPRSPESSQRIG